MICAQLTLKIEHHFMAVVPRERVRRVFSHPQVFGQCRQWLHDHLPGVDQVEVSSTARAGEMAAKADDAGALAGRMVAELYGLGILDAGVQDRATNTTRFLVIGPKDCPPTGRDKTSLMFGVPDRAGALFSALEPLQRTGVSMSKIESRPSKRKPWEYVFFVDVEGHRQEDKLVQAIGEVESRCSFLKILGSYPNSTGRD